MISLHEDKKISNYIIKEWAAQKGMNRKEFMQWIKARPSWKKIKKFWKVLDK